ncbi:MAG: metal-dependent hydrolase [Nevskiales bacterium]
MDHTGNVQAVAASAEPPLPVRRDLQFKLPAEKIAAWNKGNVHLSQFMNTLSLFFPVGERFFIDSVRNYRDRITDPELQKAVTAFIGQEAMHGREHQEYNEAMFARVPPTIWMERVVGRLLKWLQKYTPRSWQLSATIALEHFTAIMADGLLKEPRILEGAEPKFAALWNWHALEETEHKAVAYDVWVTVRGKTPLAYIERVGGLIMATIIFWSIALPFYLRIVGHERKLSDWRGWLALGHYTFGKVGFVRKLILPWLDYFRPGFHPWDHDNRHYLTRIDAIVAQTQK